jgi:branched-chain amino acid transport system ATP-binding protein
MFPRLLERRHQLGGTLSGGEQQMLAISVVCCEPRLLGDEPTRPDWHRWQRISSSIDRSPAHSGLTILIAGRWAHAELADNAL